MGRKQFRQDLSTAASNPPSNVRNVRTLDDGEVNFDYLFKSSRDRKSVDLALLALDVDDYPQGNEYMLFVKDGDVPPNLIDSLELLPSLIRHLPISDALKEIHNTFQQVLKGGKPIAKIESIEPPPRPEQQMHDVEEEDTQDDWDNDDDFDNFGLKESTLPIPSGPSRPGKIPISSSRLLEIRSDLRAVKAAGFRVGGYGDLAHAGLVCISIRCRKLGISEEVMQAWSLKPEQYFVLLIRFQQGFPNLTQIVEQDRPSSNRSWAIQVGLCSSYKPDAESAMEAFPESGATPSLSDTSKRTWLQPLFIGNSINDLFHQHFARIVKFRNVYNLGWSGAEELVYDMQSGGFAMPDMDKYDAMYENCDRALPSIVLQDSLDEAGLDLEACSFPLTAMQFALRHLVRCTEYCLVCFRNLGSTFEALKPYVCSNPLCLYHHMKLGFGPSIEWEILDQPYVVDLLISFCYARAQANRLTEFPNGLNLKIPILPSYSSIQKPNYTVTFRATPSGLKAGQAARIAALESFRVSYDASSPKLVINHPNQYHQSGLRKGDFIALVDPTTNIFTGIIYHQIRDILLPDVILGDLTHVNGQFLDALSPLPDKIIKIECHAFRHNFDDVSDEDKCKAILALLDTLPPVQEMRQYLLTQAPSSNQSLRLWQTRINPAALDVLRWIIASNRSCIVQVDSGSNSRDPSANTPGSCDDRVRGMDGYMQFKFAQGAPDKEKRFLDCVKKHSKDRSYPTIFAWHGSPVYNWHSIIRSGLMFANLAADHGRAYGHGVYMSHLAHTSMGFVAGRSMQAIAAAFSGWSNSELKINSVLSLNEVVNNTAEFVSATPHYVVANTDWIQTRYLMVKTNNPHTAAKPSGSMQWLPQDPAHTPRGISNQNLHIPVTAVSKSRRPVDTSVPKKRKIPPSGLSREDCIVIDDEDDNVSVATAIEDNEWLMDKDQVAEVIEIFDTPNASLSDVDMDIGGDRSPPKRSRYEEPTEQLKLVAGCLLDRSKTTFVPRTLDMSGIQRLPPPVDASRTASTALLKAFNTLIKTQRTTAAHELGWYIDPGEVENMYQWIVELHSFTNDLPLASDMRQAEVKSVVLEMRFTDDYPYTPPFVRVVRPRFLPFAQGGGGNVLAGGALCMELLTNTGWTAVSTIESVLLQVRIAISDKERPARLAHNGRGMSNSTYGVGEAIEAYERACRGHGWQIPAAFKNLQR